MRNSPRLQRCTGPSPTRSRRATRPALTPRWLSSAIASGASRRAWPRSEEHVADRPSGLLLLCWPEQRWSAVLPASRSQRACPRAEDRSPTAIHLVSHSSGTPAAEPGMTHRNELNVHLTGSNHLPADSVLSVVAPTGCRQTYGTSDSGSRSSVSCFIGHAAWAAPVDPQCR